MRDYENKGGRARRLSAVLSDRHRAGEQKVSCIVELEDGQAAILVCRQG